MQWQILARTRFLALGIGAILLSAGCGSSTGEQKLAVFPLGSQVALPPLIFTGLEHEWRDDLEGPEGPRVPKHRFLLVTVTVTNSGGETQGIPLMTVIDSKGNSYGEEQKGDGVPQWLGFLRTIQPAQTERGQMLFDVPPGAYKLRVSSGGDPEKEKAALIELPFASERPVDAGVASEPPPVNAPTPKR